jgi:tRNA-splicing ligase RtcB (3'-phosphate/5'-hydroxy nucleic acid ligase)
VGDLRVWHDGPLPEGVRASAQRLADSDDVRHVALMPDAHLAEDVCVGAVLATSTTLYPSAVGGDIGCGMAAAAFDVQAAAVAEPSVAARILSALAGSVPFARHRRAACPSLPPALRERCLSSSDLEALRKREAEMQLGTIGSGNHFIELQADEDGRLWLMLHSGSRGIGSAIRDHHLRRCRAGRLGLRFLDAESEAGRAYLADVAWAVDYAEASRRRMVEVVVSKLGRETAGVFFDHRLARSLREEAPSAYKDLTHVLRAQHDLARVVRRLRPVLVYKGI